MRCQHLELGKKLREACGFGADLHVVTGVLRIKHIEQRAAADVELCAVRPQQFVRNRALLIQFLDQLSLRVPRVPRDAHILFGFARHLLEAEPRLFFAAVHFLHLCALDTAVEHIPTYDQPALQIVGIAAKSVDVIADSGVPFERHRRCQF